MNGQLYSMEKTVKFDGIPISRTVSTIRSRDPGAYWNEVLSYSMNNTVNPSRTSDWRTGYTVYQESNSPVTGYDRSYKYVNGTTRSNFNEHSNYRLSSQYQPGFYGRAETSSTMCSAIFSPNCTVSSTPDGVQEQINTTMP